MLAQRREHRAALLADPGVSHPARLRVDVRASPDAAAWTQRDTDDDAAVVVRGNLLEDSALTWFVAGLTHTGTWSVSGPSRVRGPPERCRERSFRLARVSLARLPVVAWRLDGGAGSPT